MNQQKFEKREKNKYEDIYHDIQRKYRRHKYHFTVHE